MLPQEVQLESIQPISDAQTRFLESLEPFFKSGNKQYAGSTRWNKVTDKPDNLFQIFYQSSAPTSGMNAGDYWIDSDDNKISRYNGSSWSEVQDDQIAAAIADAATAQSTADGKIYVYKQDAEPGSGMSVGDIWIKTNDNNKPHRYSGSTWEAIRDPVGDWSKVIDDGGKPADNATVGGQLGTDIDDKDGNPIGEEEAANYAFGTAGEAISDEDWICAKCQLTKHTDIFDAQDTDAGNPNANGYGAADRCYMGSAVGVSLKSFIKIDGSGLPNASDILKAVLYLYFDGVLATYTISLSLVDADWDDTTITWNNQPSGAGNSDDIEKKYGSEYTVSGVNSNGWQSFDITQLVRQYKAGAINNYGFQVVVSGGGSNDNFFFHRYDHASNEPYLDVTRINRTDGKIYKADISNYETCRNIVGKALAAISNGNEGKYLHGGGYKGSYSNIGQRHYLSNSGAAVTDSTNTAERAILLAQEVSSTDLLLLIQRRDILIEKLVVANLGGTVATYGNSFDIYAPADARRAVIEVQGITSGGNDYKRIIEFYAGDDEHDVITIQEADAGTEYSFTVTWNSSNPSKITVAGATFITFQINEVYFYS